MSWSYFSVLLLVPAVMAAADYDVVIRNARVVDGTGAAAVAGDVAIRGGKIAAVGKVSGTATRTIDAGGRVAAPGFIDAHTHVEGNLERNPRAENFLLDGVTTVITGNCGSSELNLTAWFEKLAKLGIGINVASLVGHNSVRREVMGSANRQATAEEIARMQGLIDRAMRDGAVGFSTGLEYIPGTYANTAEVVELARAAAKHGGVYTSHMRDEGIREIAAIEEAANVGKLAGMRVEISHLKIDRRSVWGASAKSLELIERYRREGVDVVADQYPYDRAATNLGIRLPSWALADGKIKERLADPATRSKIAAEMRANLKEMGEPDYAFATVARYAARPEYEGKTIAAITESLGRKGVDGQIDTIFDMMNAGGASMVYKLMSEDDIERIMRWPNTAIASDGSVERTGAGRPHPRSYGTNARVLGEYVRERKVLTLEDAVRRMTSLPARTFGLADRGVLKAGMAADVVVFDPAKVADRATFENPHQYSTGFEWVLVNGVVAVDGGKVTAARGGVAVRK